MNKIDTSGFSDKDSKVPEYLDLYHKHDFIDAYAKHTDLRIAKDGPELAIGAKKDGQQDWHVHGTMQLEFLIARGLKPQHTLLDFGCGTGRLACKAVRYLWPGHYCGMDISADAIKHCVATVAGATFIQSDGTLSLAPGARFDFVWSHSVVTHLPPDVVEQVFKTLAYHDFGVFYFTFKEHTSNRRSGLKQFQFDARWLVDAASRHGLKCERDPMEWPAGQKTMKVTRA